MTESCFLCYEEAVAEDEIPISCHKANLNLFLLNQILGMTDFSNSQLKLIEEIKLCHPCIVRILNTQSMLHQLEKLEKKVSYEKYLIEVQLKESYERRDFRRQGQGQGQDQNLSGRGHGHGEGGSSLEQLRTGIVTALQSETIETMLGKIQKGGIGQVKSRRVRIMKDISIPKLDATVVSDELNEDRSAEENIREHTQTLQNQSLPIEEENIQMENEEIMNNEEGEVWNTRCTTDEYKVEDIDIQDEPIPCGSFGNPITITPLDPLEIELGLSLDMNTKTELDSEAVLDLEAKKFICGVCEARFDNYIELANHDKIHLSRPSNSKFRHSPQRPIKWKCQICTKFIKKENLKKHMNIHKIDEMTTYPGKCPRCEVYCANHEDFLVHNTRIHSEEFKCNICQKSFPRKTYLTSHLMCHSNRKNFHCKLCTSSFKRKEDYKRHIRKFHIKN